MPPSDRAMRRSGKRWSTPDQMMSVAAWTMLIGVSVMRQSIGASCEVMTSCDDEPMCMHTTTCSSLHARQNGSQWSEWMLGQPSLDGFWENDTAREKKDAKQRTT